MELKKKSIKKSIGAKKELKKLDGHFTQKSTQTSSQKRTQQSKITQKNPQKSKFTKKKSFCLYAGF